VPVEAAAEAGETAAAAPEGDDAGEGHDREPRRRRRGGRGRRDENGADAQPVLDGEAPAAVDAAPLQGSLIEEAMSQASAAPVAAPVAAPAPAPAPAAPVVEAFVLPLEQLNAIAAEAGLSWVNSDADKIAAAQAAIAAEPAPAPLGREPAPVVIVDEGPLVLVETRKDLSQVKLPFEA